MKNSRENITRWMLFVIAWCCLIIYQNCIPANRINRDKHNAESAENQYTWALNNFYAAQYSEALIEFSKLIENYPESALKADAQFMIGRCYFEKKKYPEAIYQFKLFVSNFPQHNRVKDANKYILEAQSLLQNPTRYEHEQKQPETAQQQQDVTTSPNTLGARIKAAQVLFFRGRNLDEIESELINMQNAGVNTIIIRVFQNQGDRPYKFMHTRVKTGVYFQTKHAPVVANILEPITTIAHKYNIKVFAWMTTRSCDWLIRKRPDLVGYEYNLQTHQLQQSRGLNIFHPTVKKYLAQLYKDLARYDIDGILFQDDLVLRQTEGTSREADEIYFSDFNRHLQFQLLFSNAFRGKDGKYYLSRTGYSSEFWNWAKWKNIRLLKLAQNIMLECKTINPSLKFALNLYYETVLQPENALAWLSQDLEESKKYGFDYYSMMAYHRQIQKELGISPERSIQIVGDITRKMIKTIRQPRAIIMKVQTIDWDTHKSIPDNELLSVFKTILDEGNVSLAYIPHDKKLLKDLVPYVY